MCASTDASSEPGAGAPIQRKASISSPGDALEREADAVADEVMRRSATVSTGSMPAGVRHEGVAHPHETHTQRAPAEDTPDAVDLDPMVEQALGGGRPLDAEVRAHFEPLFGADFRDVRVHTDARAAVSARAVNALAYTRGRDIVFAEGRYAPETHDGRRLLAHELTHTIQQGHAPARSNARGAAPAVRPEVTAARQLQRYRVPFGPDADCAQVVNWIRTSGPYATTSGGALTRTPLVTTWGRPRVSGAAPNFTVTTPDVTVTRRKVPPDMPEWSPSDPAVKQRWSVAWADLRAHEARHEQLGDQYAQLAQQQLRRESVQVSAPNEARAQALARPQFAALHNAWVAKLQAAHDAIDPYHVNITCPPKKTP